MHVRTEGGDGRRTEGRGRIVHRQAGGEAAGKQAMGFTAGSRLHCAADRRTHIVRPLLRMAD